MLLQTFDGLIDVWFVKRLGTDTLTGVGLASQIMLILMAVSMAVGVGSTALVARFVGADEQCDAEQAARQSILLGIALSIISWGLTYLFGPYLIWLMGGRGNALQIGTVYLNILLMGVIPFYLVFVMSGIFRGIGDMRTPLIIMAIVTFVGLIGDSVIIYGFGPIPALGVVGAGISTTFSRVLATGMFLAYLPGSTIGHCIHGSWLPHWGWFKRILRIGAPATIQGLLRSGASVAYFSILGMIPDANNALAALTIGLRVESLAFLPGFAFGTAAASMVGQNLGARQSDRAEQSAWAATWQGVWIMGLVGLVFIVFGRTMSMPFTNNQEVLKFSTLYLQINGISEPFFAFAMVLTGAFQGAGETRLPTIATVIANWIIRLPLTYYLAITLKLGVTGAWISMSGTTILLGLGTLALFKWSNWKETRV